jgi:cobalt/nickel transport system permease protein
MTVRTPPAWLLAPQAGLCACGCAGKRAKGSFVEKTLTSASGVLQRALGSDDVAAQAGLLQQIDPRVKLLTLLGLLVVAAFVHSITVLVAMYVGTLLLAVASRIGVGFFVRRVWLFIPIFTGVVVLPATLNVVTPGTIAVPLGSWFGHPVGMTAQGLTAAALIVLRVAVSVSLVVLLTLTTSWHRLLAALRAVRVPRLVVFVLAMAYRYVFTLTNAVSDMFTARKARMPGGHDARTGRHFVAATAGALFSKVHALADEVHLAMVARGYTGDVRTLAPARFAWCDAIWSVACVAIAVVLLGGDRVVVG